MIYTVIELATGKIVGASVKGWIAAVDDAFGNEPPYTDFYLAHEAHAEGFALHGYKLRALTVHS